VYVAAMPAFFSLKATLATFQIPAYASGEVATPISPIPPERASGEIRRKGTAEVTTLIGSDWAFTLAERPQKSRIPAVSFSAVGLIRKFLSGVNIAFLVKKPPKSNFFSAIGNQPIWDRFRAWHTLKRPENPLITLNAAKASLLLKFNVFLKKSQKTKKTLYYVDFKMFAYEQNYAAPGAKFDQTT
jgi:hypothetical protein